MSLAVAYGMKKKMARGGRVGGSSSCGEMDRDDDMVGRIMKGRMMSKGGMIANDLDPIADEEPNEFDDLALNDDLEFHDTGANSGDELGDHQEDEDRRDLVSRIMRSRKLKDKMPRPA